MASRGTGPDSLEQGGLVRPVNGRTRLSVSRTYALFQKVQTSAMRRARPAPRRVCCPPDTGPQITVTFVRRGERDVKSPVQIQNDIALRFCPVPRRGKRRRTPSRQGIRQSCKPIRRSGLKLPNAPDACAGRLDATSKTRSPPWVINHPAQTP